MVDTENIPQELKNINNWVCWQYETRNDKRTKVPKNPATGGNAATDNPDTWASFEQAITACQDFGLDGIGLVLTPVLGLVGLDCDHVLTGDTLAEWAGQVVGTVQSYTEVTPSGKGLRIFAYGELPPQGRKKGDFECYTAGRFLTVTGNHWPGSPLTVERRPAEVLTVHKMFWPDKLEETRPAAPVQPVNLDDIGLLSVIHQSKIGSKFVGLWNGNLNGHPSHSEGDQALCNYLAFYTGNDAQRIDKLFRQSGLMRPKWDERHASNGLTYGQMTIEKAIAATTEAYTPAQPGISISDLILPQASQPAPDQAAGPKTFKPWDWAEFWTRPPKQWHIENFIGPGDVVILAGDSGSGKTVLALALAMSAITARPYAGKFEIPKPLTIAYCTAEGIGNLPSRVKAAMSKAGLTLATIQDKFWGYDGPIIPQFFLPQNSEYSIEQFEADLAHLGARPDILILDTLALAAINGDLQDNTDVTAALIRARQFTNRTGIAVLFTHHNNREGSFRGAASLRDNADGMFIARYDKETDERKLLCKDDKWGKLKDGQEWDGILYTLDSHPIYDAPVVQWLGDYIPGKKRDELDFKEELFAVMPMGTELTGDEIKILLADYFAPGTIRNGLTRLVKSNDLERTYKNPNEPASRHNPPVFRRTVKSLL